MTKQVNQKGIDPEFSRRAAVVLRSTYWEGMYLDDNDPRQKEKRTLRDALDDARDYGDLKGEAKRVYDHINTIIEKEAAEYEQFVLNDRDGFGRFHETLDLTPPSKEQSETEDR